MLLTQDEYTRLQAIEHAKNLAEPSRRYPRPAKILQQSATGVPKQAIQHWLATQCGLIKGISWSMIAAASPETRQVSLKACWPKPTPQRKQLKANIVRCATSLKTRIMRVPTPDSDADNLLIFYPLPDCRVGASPLVLVLEISSRNKTQYLALKKLLQWNSQWLYFLLHNRLPQGSTPEASDILTVANHCLDQTQFRSTALALVNQLAKRYDCERVSLALRKRGQMDMQVVSNSARFKHQSNLIQAITAAMEEAGDQDRVINFPASDDVCHAHARLAKQASQGAIATFPLTVNKEIVGAVCLERHSRKALSPMEQLQIEQLIELITPTLWLRHRDERSLLAKARESTGKTMAKVFGPAHIKFKLLTALCATLLLFFGLVEGTWRVGADAVIEGKVQRTIAAPVDGYIATVEVRPGDAVSAGQVLGSLDDSDLVLERLKWSTLRQQMVSESREAMAQRNRAQVNIINAKISQADAELKLIEEQLARTQLRAPFDGMVIDGDLTQSLGTPVNRGDALFKIAPLAAYRIVLNVDEHDIGPIEAGQFGRLLLASMPGRPVMMRVEKITPVSTAADGRNFFRVEASLLEPDLPLQPGMEGVGKIAVGEANLFWIWTRELANWLRVATWTWWR